MIRSQFDPWLVEEILRPPRSLDQGQAPDLKVRDKPEGARDDIDGDRGGNAVCSAKLVLKFNKLPVMVL
jgi:hypothetical protein